MVAPRDARGGRTARRRCRIRARCRPGSSVRAGFHGPGEREIRAVRDNALGQRAGSSPAARVDRARAACPTLSHYPGFAFAHFQMAMVHVARGDLDQADAILREGAAIQDRQTERRERYPALGLHWLRALVRLAADDIEGALAEFDREL